jgi:hypothetical protein
MKRFEDFITEGTRTPDYSPRSRRLTPDPELIELIVNHTERRGRGETGTRFAGKNIQFSACFGRDSFTGTQGTAPDLWNCTYGSVTSASCFYGAGNSTTSLSNYASIPIGWK